MHNKSKIQNLVLNIANILFDATYTSVAETCVFLLQHSVLSYTTKKNKYFIHFNFVLSTVKNINILNKIKSFF